MMDRYVLFERTTVGEGIINVRAVVLVDSTWAPYKIIIVSRIKP